MDLSLATRLLPGPPAPGVPGSRPRDEHPSHRIETELSIDGLVALVPRKDLP